MNGKNYKRIVVTKNNARIELVKNEFTNYIDFNSGDKSPNIYWNLSEGMKFSSGYMTSDFVNNIELVGFLVSIFWEYPTNKLEIMGWQVLLCE